MERIPSKTLGDAKCSLCGGQVVVKTSTSGYAYYNCPAPPEGCGHQAFSRNERSTMIIVKGITKWRDGMREKYLAADPAAKSAEPSLSRPKQTPPPKPAKAKTPSSSSPAKPTPAPEPPPKQRGIIDDLLS